MNLARLGAFVLHIWPYPISRSLVLVFFKCSTLLRGLYHVLRQGLGVALVGFLHTIIIINCINISSSACAQSVLVIIIASIRRDTP